MYGILKVLLVLAVEKSHALFPELNCHCCRIDNRGFFNDQAIYLGCDIMVELNLFS